MNIRTSCIFLLLSFVFAEMENPAAQGPSVGSDKPKSFDPSTSVDPASTVPYVINFDESRARKEDMDVVVSWLEAKGIEVTENELASYAAFLVAPLNRSLGIAIPPAWPY